jgi:uncharacterized protein YacL
MIGKDIFANIWFLQAQPQVVKSSARYDFWAIAFLIFILIFVLIGRQYEEKWRKVRLKAKKKNIRKVLAAKQLGILIGISFAITSVLMWVINYFLF